MNKLQEIYLDWFNNYVSRETFAEHYGLTIEEATALIDLSGIVHERIVLEQKLSNYQINVATGKLFVWSASHGAYIYCHTSQSSDKLKAIQEYENYLDSLDYIESCKLAEYEYYESLK